MPEGLRNENVELLTEEISAEVKGTPEVERSRTGSLAKRLGWLGVAVACGVVTSQMVPAQGLIASLRSQAGKFAGTSASHADAPEQAVTVGFHQDLPPRTVTVIAGGDHPSQRSEEVAQTASASQKSGGTEDGGDRLVQKTTTAGEAAPAVVAPQNVAASDEVPAAKAASVEPIASSVAAPQKVAALAGIPDRPAAKPASVEPVASVPAVPLQKFAAAEGGRERAVPRTMRIVEEIPPAAVAAQRVAGIREGSESEPRGGARADGAGRTRGDPLSEWSPGHCAGWQCHGPAASDAQLLRLHHQGMTAALSKHS